MLTSRVKLVIAGMAVAAAAYSGWWLRDLQAEAAESARLKAEAKVDVRLEKLAARVAADTEAAVSGIRIENRTIYNETQREIQTNTVYRDCRLTADGLRLANKARAGSASQPAGIVPALVSSPW